MCSVYRRDCIIAAYQKHTLLAGKTQEPMVSNTHEDLRLYLDVDVEKELGTSVLKTPDGRSTVSS